MSREVWEAWRRHVRDVTPAEVAALLPLVARRRGLTDLAVNAYRAGRATAEAGTDTEPERTPRGCPAGCCACTVPPPPPPPPIGGDR